MAIVNCTTRRPTAHAAIAIAALLLIGSYHEAEAQESAVLKAIVAAGWRLAGAQAALPPVQLIHTEALEIQNYIEYAFDGGALRLCVSPGPKGGKIFAILANTREPRYRNFSRLVSSGRYGTYRDGTYVVVVPLRPVNHQLFEKLKRNSWTEDELQQHLGAPSYNWHVHGIGYLGITYVPQGVSFVANPGRPNAPVKYQVLAPNVEVETEQQYNFDLPPLAALSHLDYATLQRECRETFAKQLLRQRTEIDGALARGKRSPDGRFVVGHVNLGCLANTEEVVIQERSKPEQRYPAPHFTGDDDYIWLDARTIVFKVWAVDIQFYAMNALTGAKQLVATEPYDDDLLADQSRVTDFGVSGPQQFSYKTPDGVTHEVTVPSITPEASK